MKGTHRIIVQNRRIRYDFQVRRNLTVIQGDSATGKTTLVEMIREYYENGAGSGVQLQCDRTCAVLAGRNWEAELSAIRDSIVFIDEGNEFILTDEFASKIQVTDNYYVLITRESIPSLPYSVEEIYGIRNSGRYGTIRQVYNELFHLYSEKTIPAEQAWRLLITEDSNSGFQFFQAVCAENGMFCESAGGKSNIFEKAARACAGTPGTPLLVIADGAAFGAEMAKLSRLMREYPGLSLYLPESFEWLILKSDVLEDREVRDILASPGEFIESQNYFSWERFFTVLLTEKAAGSYLRYAKHSLNAAYLQKKVQNKILAAMEIAL